MDLVPSVSRTIPHAAHGTVVRHELLDARASGEVKRGIHAGRLGEQIQEDRLRYLERFAERVAAFGRLGGRSARRADGPGNPPLSRAELQQAFQQTSW